MRSIRRLILPLVLLCSLTACHSWQREPLAGPSPRQLPSPARLTMTDGTTRILWAAAVERDSVVGLVGSEPGRRTRAAVALAEVRRIQGSRVDFAISAGAAVVVSLLLIYLYGLLEEIGAS